MLSPSAGFRTALVKVFRRICQAILFASPSAGFRTALVQVSEGLSRVRVDEVWGICRPFEMDVDMTRRKQQTTVGSW